MKKLLLTMLMAAMALCIVACSTTTESGSDSQSSDSDIDPILPPPPSVTITVSGTMVDEDNIPIEGVVIRSIEIGVKEFDAVITGADGKFSVDGVSRVNEFKLTATKDGYFAVERNLTILDILDGKNELGNLVMSKPSETHNFISKITELDGVTPVKGVNVSVEGFPDINALSCDDGTITMEGVPVTIGHNTIFNLEKDGYGRRRISLCYEDVKDNTILKTGIMIESENMSPSYTFSLINDGQYLHYIVKTDGEVGSASAFRTLIRNNKGDFYQVFLFDDELTFVGKVKGALMIWENMGQLTNDEKNPQFADYYTYNYSCDNNGSTMDLKVEKSVFKLEENEDMAFAIVPKWKVGDDYVCNTFSSYNDVDNEQNTQWFTPYDYMKISKTDGSFINAKAGTVKISGIVKRDGLVAEGAIVNLKNLKGEVVESIVTDESGEYVFNNVDKAQNYIINAVHEDIVSVDQTLLAVNLLQQENDYENILETFDILTPSKKTTIIGKVTKMDNVTPLAGVKISVKGTEMSVVTDENGEYKLEDVLYGDGGLTVVYESEFYNNTKSIVYTLAHIEGETSAYDVSMGHKVENGVIGGVLEISKSEDANAIKFEGDLFRTNDGIRFIVETDKVFGTGRPFSKMWFKNLTTNKAVVFQFTAEKIYEAWISKPDADGNYTYGNFNGVNFENKIDEIAGKFTFAISKNAIGGHRLVMDLDNSVLDIAGTDDFGFALISFEGTADEKFYCTEFSSYRDAAICEYDTMSANNSYYVAVKPDGTVIYNDAPVV